MNRIKPLLSICIPANNRIDYVRRTLGSIYNDKNLSECSISDFEVIISDNDPNQTLSQLIREFKFSNIYYFPTSCEGFTNSFHVLTYANGHFLKLHNSQELWNPGALSYVINLIKINLRQKPLIFFTGGLLKKGVEFHYNSFDRFNYNLSYLSSWSNGFSIWQEDFIEVKESLTLNPLFPHTSIFLTQFNKKNYTINDYKLFTTQFIKKRGGHNKFHAFSIEYPSLIETSSKSGHIGPETQYKILNDILINFLPLLYFNVKIAKRETFSSEGFKTDIQKYFPKGSYWLVIFLSFIIPVKVLWRKIKIKYLLKSEL